MHELAVTESILEISLKHAQAAGATRVSDIYITIGQLASIVDDSVQFYWDMISQGTMCVGAVLHFERVPACMACLQCGNEYELVSALENCPKCGSYTIKVISGEEFYVNSIEVEKEEETPK